MNLDEVFHAIDHWRIASPHADALVQLGGRRITFAGLADELEAISAGLEDAGMRPQDAVVFSVRPSVEAVILILAIVRCGGIVVAADPGMSPELFAARTAPVRPRWVITESLLYSLARRRFVRTWLESRGARLPNFDVPGSKLVLTGRWPRPTHAIAYSELAGAAARPRRPLDAGAPAFVVFTSGTTGSPTAVVHTAGSLAMSLTLISEQLGLHPEDRVYSDQLHMLVPALIAGATSTIPRHGFAARRVLRDLHRCRATHVYWAAAQAERVVRAARPLPDSLRLILLGSAPVPSSFLRRFRRALPPAARVYAAYALTEMLPVSWVEMSEKLAYVGPGDLVGAPCRGVEIRIAPDGEVVLKGANLCAGYLGCPPLAEVATGDIGFLSEGRLVLLGRKKDMIVRGEHNIYPALVEEVVAAVPGVRRSALVGVYDEQAADEVVVLAVELDAGSDAGEVERRVRRELWSGPRRIDVEARPDRIVMTDVPLAGRSAKVDRSALREAVVRMLRC